METRWKKSVLEHVPHGEEGSLQCTEEEMLILSRLLLKKGYAVCLTGGDFGDEIRVSWVYAGEVDALNWPDYDNIAFTSVDYLNAYPQAYMEDLEDEMIEAQEETV